MANIHSATLSYDPVEDRIHLALLVDGGTAVRLWLTQRLARTLVGALANHLEKVEAMPLPSVRHVLMAQEQAEAVSALRPAPPVEVDRNDGGHLIGDISVTLAPEQIRLAFASGLDIKPCVVLDHILVRQWLGLLHRQFVRAGWPQDVWPGWMLDNDPGVSAGATRH